MNTELGDDDVRALFAQYRGAEQARVRAAGVAAAQRRGLARRRRRHAFLSAAVIAGMLVPAAAVGLTAGGGPIGGDLPRPQRTGGEIPAGGLTMAQLLTSSVQMPVFEADTAGVCPHGEVGFADDRLNLYVWPDTGQYMSYVDIDRDGSFETVLHVRCLAKEKVVAEQVLVVAPGTSGASVRLVGRVIGTGGAISAVDRMAMGADGTVAVKVAGARTCCGAFYSAVEHQWRVYAWDGKAFRQRDGSDAFWRTPGDLVVAAQELRLKAGVGSFLVTITNAGTQAVDSVMLTLVAKGMRATDPEWRTTAPGVDPATIENTLLVTGLEPGQSRSIEVHVRLASLDSRSGSLSVTALGILGGGEVYDEAADANPGDNEKIEVALRFD
ncbi:hypothetical protein Rhe02_25020 [Rhizocola hellebori]|uniref:DUF11 domain-containing protein n=1 Tax=Rhizocola hellebori TaxID=1392758 RepID=A0A8J3VFD3_9ACTN|nr:hypothetical protein [Rhizocola hellebori]GIH04435.1 hypothetical protein Rhe02_25020 [Rhizocola hellebori]